MSDGEIAEPQRGGTAHVVPFPAAPNRVTFTRDELRAILDLYGRKVAEGEWRDYAIDFTRDRAVFSIFGLGGRSRKLPPRTRSGQSRAM